MARREEQGQPAGILEILFGEMRSAVQDIRSKLIDEGWFGRRAGASPQQNLARDWGGPSIHDQPGLSISRPPFEEQWAARAPGEARDAAEPGGMDLDR